MEVLLEIRAPLIVGARDHLCGLLFGTDHARDDPALARFHAAGDEHPQGVHAVGQRELRAVAQEQHIAAVGVVVDYLGDEVAVVGRREEWSGAHIDGLHPAAGGGRPGITRQRLDDAREERGLVLGVRHRVRRNTGFLGGCLDQAVVQQVELQLVGHNARDFLPEGAHLPGNGDDSGLHGILPGARRRSPRGAAGRRDLPCAIAGAPARRGCPGGIRPRPGGTPPGRRNHNRRRFPRRAHE